MRRLGDPSFNRLGIKTVPWGLGRFGGGYFRKVLSIAPNNLVAYWPLWETQGTITEDISGNNRDGVYSNVALGQPGIGDGRTSGLYNGANSFTNLYSASLNAGFNGDEGTLILWPQIPIGAWTDGVLRTILHWQVDAANEIFLRKEAGNNTLSWKKDSGGIVDSFSTVGHSDTEFFMMAITWSLANDRMRGYKNDNLEGTAVGIGGWVGNLNPAAVVIGGEDIVPAQNFIDNLAHCFAFDRELTQAEVTSLSVI